MNHETEGRHSRQALPSLLDFWILCDFIGLPKDRSSRLMFWRGAKNGTFPAPVKLSEARIAWRRDEIEAWLANRPRAIYSKAKDGGAFEGGSDAA